MYRLGPGIYYVGVFIDPLNAVDEQIESNNATWSRRPLRVGATPADRWMFYR